MSQDDGGFGIRLNIRDDDDFSTPLISRRTYKMMVM